MDYLATAYNVLCNTMGMECGTQGLTRPTSLTEGVDRWRTGPNAVPYDVTAASRATSRRMMVMSVASCRENCRQLSLRSWAMTT